MMFVRSGLRKGWICTLSAMPLSSSSLYALVILAVALPILQRVVGYRRALASIQLRLSFAFHMCFFLTAPHSYHPGQRFLFNCVSGINNIVPWVIPGVCPGSSGLFRWKYDLFKRFGVDVVSYVRPPKVSTQPWLILDVAGLRVPHRAHRVHRRRPTCSQGTWSPWRC